MLEVYGPSNTPSLCGEERGIIIPDAAQNLSFARSSKIIRHSEELALNIGELIVFLCLHLSSLRGAERFILENRHFYLNLWATDM